MQTIAEQGAGRNISQAYQTTEQSEAYKIRSSAIADSQCCHAALKTLEWKTWHQIAGVENARVENEGVECVRWWRRGVTG